MDAKLLEHYRTLLGFVPDNIKRRINLAELTGQEESVEAVEHMREVLIHNNPLGARIQQLVHLAMLVAIGEVEPAKLHVRGALLRRLRNCRNRWRNACIQHRGRFGV